MLGVPFPIPAVVVVVAAVVSAGVLKVLVTSLEGALVAAAVMSAEVLVAAVVSAGVLADGIVWAVVVAADIGDAALNVYGISSSVVAAAEIRRDVDVVSGAAVAGGSVVSVEATPVVVPADVV